MHDNNQLIGTEEIKTVYIRKQEYQDLKNDHSFLYVISSQNIGHLCNLVATIMSLSIKKKGKGQVDSADWYNELPRTNTFGILKIQLACVRLS